MDNSDYFIKVETVQSKVIKVLFEVIKEVLLGTVNLVFNKNGISLKQTNGIKKSLVYLKLNAENFEEYICNKEEYVVGFDTSNFHKITKSIQNTDKIVFYVKKDNPNDFVLSRINELTDCEYKHSIKLCQVPYSDFVIPDTVYWYKLTLKSNEFQVACKNLNSLNCDIVNISFKPNCITLNSHNDFSENSISIKQQMKVSEIPNKYFEKEKTIEQGNYLLQYILLFTKATALDKNFEIYLNPENPLTLSYAVGDLGNLDFMLFPEFLEDTDSDN